MQDENTMAVTVSDAGTTSMAMMNDGAMMDRMIRFAEIMATGKATIPNELRNVGDCLAITMQAMAWKMMPQAVAQKTHFINGKIGYEAQLVAAAINNSGAVRDTFHFEWFGPWERIIGKFEIKKGDKGEYRVPGWKLADEEGIGIKVWATLRNEDSPRVLELLLAQARTRNSTLWADDPRQQLAYLAQKRWARLYAPGVILGVYTTAGAEVAALNKRISELEAEASDARVIFGNLRKTLGLKEGDSVKAGIEALQADLLALQDDIRRQVQRAAVSEQNRDDVAKHRDDLMGELEVSEAATEAWLNLARLYGANSLDDTACLLGRLKSENMALKTLNEAMPGFGATHLAISAGPFVTRTPKRPPRFAAKFENAKAAAISAARQHGSAEVFALIPVGKAVRKQVKAVEFKEAKAA